MEMHEPAIDYSIEAGPNLQANIVPVFQALTAALHFLLQLRFHRCRKGHAIYLQAADSMEY